jgi:hypothetical protein
MVTVFATSVVPGSGVSLARTSTWIAWFVRVDAWSATATRGGGVGVVVVVLAGGAAAAGALVGSAPTAAAMVFVDGCGTVVVGAETMVKEAVVVDVGGGVDVVVVAGSSGSADDADAAGSGLSKDSPRTRALKFDVPPSGTTPSATTATAATPAAPTVRPGCVAPRGRNGMANRAPRPSPQRRRPREMSRKARTTSGSKSRLEHAELVGKEVCVGPHSFRVAARR